MALPCALPLVTSGCTALLDDYAVGESQPTCGPLEAPAQGECVRVGVGECGDGFKRTVSADTQSEDGTCTAIVAELGGEHLRGPRSLGAHRRQPR